MVIQNKQEIYIVLVPRGDAEFAKYNLDGFCFGRVNGQWRHYTGGNILEATNIAGQDEIVNLLEERFQNVQERFVMIEKDKNYIAELFPDETEIDTEAEGRYPVNTHNTPNNSPYVGSKITFIHGVNWIINYIRAKR